MHARSILAADRTHGAASTHTALRTGAAKAEARRNLYRYYNESDYAALRTLVELGLLKDGQYDLTPANGMPTPTTGVPT